MMESTRRFRERRANEKRVIPLTEKGKVFKLCSQEEKERRIRIVEGWLRQGIVIKSHLQKRIKKKWDIEYRMAYEYIKAARDRLLLHLNESREEHRADSLAFYEGVITSSEATVGEKVRARERVDKLLGLEQPLLIKAEVIARPNGVPVDDLDLESKRKLLKEIREKNGQGNLIENP